MTWGSGCDLSNGPCPGCEECVPKASLIERIFNLFFKKPQPKTRNPNVNWKLIEEMFGPEAEWDNKWKNGVMNMKSSWYNEPMPDEPGELSGLETGSRDIHPCNDVVENTTCPCQKAHLLHYKKEPLSYYRNAVWGTKCAIEDLLGYLEHSITVLKGKNQAVEENLHNKSIDLHDANLLISEASRAIANRCEHLIDCPSVNPVAAVRGNAKCTCKLEDFMKMGAKLDKWLSAK